MSLLSDEDIKQRCLDWLRETKPNQRSTRGLVDHVRKVILPDVLSTGIISEELGNKLKSLSQTTVSKYLKLWGFDYKSTGKDFMYIDGHERQDVKEYRLQWARQMMEWKKRMEFYPYGNEEEVVQPTLREEEKKVVLVTHDESTFYANDGKKTRWQLPTESAILPKGQGKSVMVSEFMCACHGTMKALVNGEERSSRTIFYPGGDNWWKCEDLNAQLKEDVLPLFELLHLDCISLFAFDQSQNHRAFGNDALLASRMSSGEIPYKPESPYRFRDGFYRDPESDQAMMQSMYFMRNIDFRKFKTEFKRLKPQVGPRKRFGTENALRTFLVQKLQFPRPVSFYCNYKKSTLQ